MFRLIDGPYRRSDNLIAVKVIEILDKGVYGYYDSNDDFGTIIEIDKINLLTLFCRQDVADPTMFIVKDMVLKNIYNDMVVRTMGSYMPMGTNRKHANFTVKILDKGNHNVFEDGDIVDDGR